MTVFWADIPGLSSAVGSWLWRWQQYWQQPKPSGVDREPAWRLSRVVVATRLPPGSCRYVGQL